MTGRRGPAEAGIALLHVVLLMALLTAVAGGAAMLARIEVFVSRHHRTEREAAYAAQSMLAVAIRDLERVAEWREPLSGSRIATFADGAVDAPRDIPGGGTVRVCCGPGTLTERARTESGLPWRPYGWESLSGLLNLPAASRYYLVAWIADDEDGDGDLTADANGRILLRAEAVTPFGVRKTVQAAVERAPPDPSSGVYSPGLRMLTWREIR
jgi:hypothetical protein